VFDKPALTEHEILDLLARRWSTRAFSDLPVDAEALLRLFEAARWAPSSGNAQPWSYLLATMDNPAEHEKLGSVLNVGNSWARKAPVLALSVATIDRGPDKPNRHAWHDVGLADENLVIQAVSMGLSVHMMGGFDAQKARDLFAIPSRHEPVAMIAIGYPGDPNSLSEELRQKDLAPRHRRAIHEFVFSGRWGESAGLE
jgi:nitroreductase